MSFARLAELCAALAQEFEKLAQDPDLQLQVLPEQSKGRAVKPADVLSRQSLIGAAALAGMLGVNVRTLRRMRHEKQIPEPCMQRPLRWRRADVESWLADGRLPRRRR